MAGGNETQRSDRMELPNHSDVQIRDERERLCFSATILLYIVRNFLIISHFGGIVVYVKNQEVGDPFS
jgi:hypothetical protein